MEAEAGGGGGGWRWRLRLEVEAEVEMVLDVEVDVEVDMEVDVDADVAVAVAEAAGRRGGGAPILRPVSGLSKVLSSARTRSRSAPEGSRLLPLCVPLSSADSSASMMSFDSHTGLPPRESEGVWPVGMTFVYQSGFLPGEMSTKVCS